MGGTRKDEGAQFELPLFGGEAEVSAGARTVPQVPPSPRRAQVAPVTPAAEPTPVSKVAEALQGAASAARPEPVQKTQSPPVAGPRLRVIQGEGKREREKLGSRDAVVRVLLEAGADLLLRRISPERAGEIERRVDRILHLFDQVDDQPLLMSVLKRQLDDLEALMRETRDLQTARRTQPRP